MTSTHQPSVDSCIKFADRVGLLAAAKGSNFVFSPLSIRAALSLAAVGSKGQTLDQFLSFLGSSTVDDLNAVTNRLLASVRATGSDENGDCGSNLSFVNGVWVEQTSNLKASFQEIAASFYDAVAKSVDFKNEPLEAAEEVNLWVENKTNKLIEGLIPSDAVNFDTRIILANGLYFKGTWAEKFDTSKTKNGSFHLLDGRTLQVPFMTLTDRPYPKDQFIASFNGFKVLKLPYEPKQGGGKFSMLVFLPDNRDGLYSLVQKAVSSPDFFNHHVPASRVETGKFLIPKFKISSGFNASEALKELGLDIPFSKLYADFTEMALSPCNRGRLFISSVHHKATIEVGEKGIEASAATAVIMQLQCCRPPTDFVADHPFMFAIREDQTGALLFVGHVVNPLEVESSM